MHQQAAKASLCTKSIHLFNENIFEGYVVKRNKHGGSFKNIHTKRHVRTEMKSCFHTFGFGEGIPLLEIQPMLEKMFGKTIVTCFDAKPIITLKKSDLTPSKRKIKQYPPDYVCVHCQKQLSGPRSYSQHGTILF